MCFLPRSHVKEIGIAHCMLVYNYYELDSYTGTMYQIRKKYKVQLKIRSTKGGGKSKLLRDLVTMDLRIVF